VLAAAGALRRAAKSGDISRATRSARTAPPDGGLAEAGAGSHRVRPGYKLLPWPVLTETMLTREWSAGLFRSLELLP